MSAYLSSITDGCIHIHLHNLKNSPKITDFSSQTNSPIAIHPAFQTNSPSSIHPACWTYINCLFERL